MTAKKIISLLDLSKKTKELKNQNKKIVHCHGVFDVLHIGHIKHFNTARKRGDILIITVTPDSFVNKGPNRPAFNQYQRIEALEAIEFIDYIILSNNPSSKLIIKKIKPDIYFKGPDYKNNFDDLTKKIFLEKKEVEENKGKIFYTKEEKFSSSSLIKNFIGIFNEKQRKELISLVKVNF